MVPPPESLVATCTVRPEAGVTGLLIFQTSNLKRVFVGTFTGVAIVYVNVWPLIAKEPVPTPLTSTTLLESVVPCGNVISTVFITPAEAVLNRISYAVLVFTILFDCNAKTPDDTACGVNTVDVDN